MRSLDQLRDDEKFLEWLSQTPRVRLALIEVRAEISALETREAFPVSGETFFVAGPGGKLFRVEKSGPKS
jgi:hypothetical protein